MDIRSQKGYTGIDIAISVIVITIFISLIAVLIYRFNSSSNEVQLKSKATEIAIDEIEKVKVAGFKAYEEMDQTTKEDKEGNSLVNQSVEEEHGFYKTISVEDYTDTENNEDKISNLVKRVTVTISYMVKGQEQQVSLSTILSKENE
jgi:type II secretory pathway pseudopilin PulG